MSRDRPPWDFDYAPVSPAAGSPEETRDLVVATPSAIDPARVAAAACSGARAASLFARAPLFWTRLVLDRAAQPAVIAERLRAEGISIRYVASAERPTLALAPPLDLRGAPVARPDGWAARAEERAPPAADADGSWFLRDGEGGVAVDRAPGCTGAGTRLAVIDDDALGTGELDLDAELPVEIHRLPRNQLHGALVVAWASRARGFEGVAPRASARLYVIPKPGTSVVGLPLALARAASDGADVIVCATYVEGSTSPMLDDALELSSRLGRRGRGTAVVMPTGREASSPPGSLHASFSLGLGEPACDPRVFCIAPGARGGGWFFWRDRRGRSRPFANRGPAVRWLAPGDDVTYPFTLPGGRARLFHAESSGAAAMAAGVLLSVLGANPALRLPELGAILDSTLEPVAPAVPASREPLADRADALPEGRDRDGHNAKHGLGLLRAGDACMFAADPICAALLTMGEPGAARAWADARRRDPVVAGVYSRGLARWAVRALLADPEGAHALRVILRHLRLVGGHEARRATHGDGAIARQLALLLARLSVAHTRAPVSVRAEARDLARRVRELSLTAEVARPFEVALVAAAAVGFGATCDPV